MKKSTIVFIVYILALGKTNADGNIMPLKDEMEGKIVGGDPIALEKLPYTGQIFNLGAMCAGTIINSWTLLTAAHCFDANKDTDEIFVQTASRYVYDFNADQYNTNDIILHEDYNQTGIFACDIALLFVDRPITLSKKAKKAILVNSQSWMTSEEKHFIVSGWGQTSYGGDISKNDLMMAKLRFVPRDECSRLHNMDISKDMFCLYGDGERDTCKGDSGGGVFWNSMIVGITSHGDGCAQKSKPSVYSNVFYFRDWIKRQVMGYVRKNCRVIKR